MAVADRSGPGGHIIATQMPNSPPASSSTLSVLRGALALVSAQPMTWLASLITTTLVPRYLDAHALGQYAVALTITGVAGALLSLGLTISLVRRVAAAPADAEVDGTAALVLVLGLGIPAAVGLGYAMPLFGVLADDRMILPIALTGMVVMLAQSVLSSVLIGQHRYARFAWINALCVLVTALAEVSVLIAGGTLAAYMLVAVVVTSAAVVIGWRTAGLSLDRRGIKRGRILDLARDGLPFLASNILIRLRVDAEIGMLAALQSQQVVGWWTAANRIVGMPIFVPAMVTTPLLPALSRCIEDQDQFRRTLRHTLVMVVVLTVPASAVILALAPALPGILGWRAEFQQAVPLITVLSAQLPLVAIGMVIGVALIALGRERQWLAVNALIMMLSVGAGYLAIPAFGDQFQNGAIGAALVRVLCEVSMISAGLILLPRGTINWSTITVCGRAVLAGIASGAAALWLAPLWLPLALAGSGSVYLLALLTLRIIQPSDLRTIRGMALDTLARRGVISRR